MKFGLNRAQLKNIALVFMVLDNLWLRNSSLLSPIVHPITRFVSPLFAWLMVDGFFHTKSRGKYCARLWIAAIITQVGSIISYKIFDGDGIPDNIFLTLAFGFTIIWLFDIAKNTQETGKKYMLKVAAILMTFVALILFIPLPFGNYIMLEGGIQLIPLILFAYFFHDSKAKQAIAITIYSIFMFFAFYSGFAGIQNSFQMFCFNSDWLICIVVPFIFLYNGQEGRKTAFSKWFFYVFYPLHLWVIAIIDILYITPKLY